MSATADSGELRQRRKPEEEDPDSPVLVEREDEDEEEDNDDAGADAGARLTKRLLGGGGAGGPAKDPLAAATGAERPVAMKIPKKKRRAGGEQGDKGGIKWLPLLFLLFMFLPALFTAVDFIMQLPFFAKFARRFTGPPNYRQCLTDYYRRVHPERLQEVDLGSILRKYKGKEGLLARNLEARYGRKFKCP